MDVASIETSRQAIKSRIAELNRLATSDAKILESAMTEVCTLCGEYSRLSVMLVVFDAYRALVERTPQDTGRARASWNLGTAPSDAVPPAGDYSAFKGDVSGAVARAIDAVPLDAELFCISSALEYMPFLEAGWSKQAPAGFIALTFREVAEQLRNSMRAA